MRRVGQLLSGLASVVVIVALLVAVPWALVRFVGWPLPTSVPTLVEVRQSLELGISDSTVVKMLAVVVWIAWAQVAWALVAEIVGVLRRQVVRARLVLPGMHVLAGRLVAGALLVGAAFGPRTEVAVAPLHTSLAAAPVEPEPAPPSPPAQQQPEAEPAVEVTTVERDSWWKLAEQHLGDGMRWREVRDLNVGRTVAGGERITESTEHLGVGWALLVPADGSVGTPAGADAGGEAGELGEVTVEEGDHFWKIAEEQLTEAHGGQPTDAEVATYWRRLVGANRDRLLPPGDPDLIYPGQELVVPDVPSASPASGSGDRHPAAPGQPPEDDETGEPPPTARPGDLHRPAESADDGTPSEDERSSGWAGALASPERGRPVEVSVEDDPLDEARTVWGVPVNATAGIVATGLLGAGVVAVWRRRNRLMLARRRTGYRLPTPAPDVVRQMGRLDAAAPEAHALDDLASLMATVPEDAHPVLVTTSEDGTVSLLFDDDTELPAPPEPWTLADDGDDGPVGWTARLGDRGVERSIGLPLLVTLGGMEDRTVLANVGAMRRLVIDGDEPALARYLRTVAMEVALSRIAGPVEVLVADDDRLATLDQVRTTESLQDEVDAAVREKEGGVIVADRAARLLIAHTDSARVEVPEGLDAMIGLVAVGSDGGRWGMTVGSDGTGRVRLPDGALVELHLPDVDIDLVDEEFDRQSEQLEEQRRDALNGHPVEFPATGLEAAPASAPPTSEASFCEVRLLGRMVVVRDGKVVDGLSRLMKEVLAYLATHPDGVSGPRLEDAVWAGSASRVGSQRVRSVLTKLRAALGDGPDGTSLLPPRETADDPIRVVHTSTDIDRALAAISRARRHEGEDVTAELAAALDLVRGEPLQDLPVSWGTDVASQAVVHLQKAATELARARRETADHDGAEWAIRQGLTLCDPCEPLYVEWAELEAAQGRHDQIPRLWERLCDRLEEPDGDAASVIVTTEPDPSTRSAFAALTTTSRH